jgi:flagellar FliL protein
MAEQGAGQGTKKRKWSWYWIVLAALVLITSVGTGLFAWRYFTHAGGEGAPPVSEGSQGNAAAHQAADAKQVLAAKSTLSLDPFVVNLADKTDLRFVKATFHLGLAEEDETATKNPVIIAATRDAIISLLSTKTSDQILTVEGKNHLRREIRERVNAFFAGTKAKVQEVYIVEFVVQL